MRDITVPIGDFQQRVGHAAPSLAIPLVQKSVVEDRVQSAAHIAFRPAEVPAGDDGSPRPSGFGSGPASSPLLCPWSNQIPVNQGATLGSPTGSIGLVILDMHVIRPRSVYFIPVGEVSATAAGMGSRNKPGFSES